MVKNSLAILAIIFVLAVAVTVSIRNAEKTGKMPTLFDESANTEGNMEINNNIPSTLEDNKSDSVSADENNMSDVIREFTTEGGVKVEVKKEGQGAEAQAGTEVNVHYTGMLTDGTVFDSSVSRGVPFSFTLGAGQVIRGWEEGVLGMKVGEVRTLTIPSDMAYGDGGIPGAIPPKATLIFDVEMVSF
ncbi:MAG: FKBP-type peptidyl-prolyl cis-trans isomerase [Candidatus Paceibacterota bacterium]